jgi:hypothetical protein
MSIALYPRARKVWSITEALALQREYELLCLTPEEMAERHRRSVNAIISRLESEDYYTPDAPPNPELISSSTITENDGLSDRLTSVETNLNEMREVVTQMMELMSQDFNKQKKNKATR